MNKQWLTRGILGLAAALGLLAYSGCGDVSEAPEPSPARSGSTLVADPDPIQLCDGTGLGVTTLSWKTTAAAIQIRVGTYNGALLTHQGSEGTASTGKWVHDGMKFYLQDVSVTQKPVKENTLAVVEVNLTDKGCR